MKPKEEKVTKELLLTYLLYDHENGRLFWRNGTDKSFPKELIGQEAGSVTGQGYRSVSFYGEQYATHRLIWFINTGDWPDIVDHRDTNKLNNRFSNLREATQSNNLRNVGASKNNKLGIKGLSVCRKTGKYRVDVSHMGKRKNLGRYSSVEEAKMVYNEFVSSEFGEFSRLS